MFGFVTLNADLIITQWSDYLTALTGIHPSQVIGKPLLQLFPDLHERGIDIAIQHVLETGAPLNLSRILHRYIFPAQNGTLVEQSALIHPLLQGDQVIGVILNIQDVSDRSLIELELSHRLRLLEALRAIDRFSIADDLHAALQHTVKAAVDLLGVSRGNLCLFEDGKCLRFTSEPALSETSQNCSECGICIRLKETRRPLRVFEPSANPWVPAVYAEAQALLAVPLLGHDQMLGTLLVAADSPTRITGTAVEILESLAGAAAGAILAHHLRQNERRRMQALEIIYQASAQLRSANSFAEILQQSLTLAVQLVGAAGGLLWMPSKDRRTLEAVLQYNLPAETLQMRLPVDKSLAGEVFSKGAPLQFSSSEIQPSSEAAIPAAMEETLRLLPGWMYAPLSAEGSSLGVMGVCSDAPQKFGNESLQALQTIAEITAVTLQRVQNLERANRRGQQLAYLNEVSQRLAAVSDVQEAYRAVAHCLVNELGYALAVISERDPAARGLVLRIVHSRDGKPHPVPERIPYGVSITSEVFDTGQSLLLNRVAGDPRYLKLADFPAGSQLCVPVWQDGVLTAVITVEHPEENAFDETDLNVLHVMAAHLGAAMSNIGRYQRMAAMAARPQADISTEGVVIRDMNGKILYVSQAVRALTDQLEGGVFERSSEFFELLSRLPSPQDVEAWKALAQAPILRDLHLPAKTGGFLDFHLTISPILDADGRPLGLLNVIKKIDPSNLIGSSA